MTQSMVERVAQAIRAEVEIQLGELGYVSPDIDEDGEETGILAVDGKIDLRALSSSIIKALPVTELLEALRPIEDAINVNDGDTLARFSPDTEIIWTATSSWTSSNITLGDLRKIADTMIKVME